MAAPESQFQTAGISAPYSFTPTHYTPTAVNVPSETGALLAQAGKTALGAGQNLQGILQSSPLNPAVRAQMHEEAARYHYGQALIAHAEKNKAYGYKVGAVGAGGPSMVAPATVPVAQQENLDLDTDTDTDTKKPPTPAPAAPPPPAPATPPAPAPQTHQEQMGQVSPRSTNLFASANGAQPPGPDAFQGPTQGQTSAAVQEALGRNQFASADQGVPAGYQPPSTAPQPQAEPGGIMDQYAQGYAQGQDQKRQVDLSNWQEQTARQTAPMTASDAMAWMKQRTTLATGVTRLDHGGPNGEPAFAFHMKSPDGKPGGTNIVPVSQMVQNGAGPTVAAQNTSVVLSQGDKLRQQQQNALAAPPSTPTDQGAQPQQIASDQGGAQGPPPAPGYDAAAVRAQLQPYTAVASRGGPSPADLTAQAAPGPVQPTQPSQPTQPPEDHPARIQAESGAALPPPVLSQPISDQDRADLNADADAPKAKRTWQTDPRGGRFTTLASPRTGYYEQRFYKGTPGWQDGLWTPENQKRQEVLDTYGSASSNIPRGKMLDKDKIDNMSMPELDAKLAEAVWWKSHPNAMPPEQQTRLNHESEASKAYAQIIDQATWSQQNNVDPKAYNESEILHAFEAATRDGIMSPDDVAKAFGVPLPINPEYLKALADPVKFASTAYHNLAAGGSPVNPFAYAMGSNIKNLTSHLDGLSEYQGRAVESPEWPTKLVGLDIPQWHISVGIPAPSDPSRISELNTMVQGTSRQSQQRALDYYRQKKSALDAQYVKDVKNFAYAGVRVPDTDIDNMNALSKPNGRIKDVDANGKSLNPFMDDQGNLINPYGPPPGQAKMSPSSPTPGPGPAPTPRPSATPFEISDWKTGEQELAKAGYKKGGNKAFTGPDGKTYYY